MLRLGLAAASYTLVARGVAEKPKIAEMLTFARHDLEDKTGRKGVFGRSSRGVPKKCDHNAIRILHDNNYKPGWISELFQISKSTVKRIIYGG